MKEKDKSVIWTSSPSEKPNKEENSSSKQTHITEQTGDEEHVTVLTLPQKSNHQTASSREKVWLKPVLIATVSAVMLGFFLGGVTLKVFGVMSSDDEQVTSTTPTKTALAKDKEIKKANLKTYMIQGGVFTTEKSANEWLEKYHDQTIPAYLWEREDKYYLFAGMALNQEEAKKKLNALQVTGLDSFVKDWEIKPANKSLNKSEEKWLNEFLHLWNDSVLLNNEKDTIQTSEWKRLLKTMPKAKSFIKFEEHIEAFIKKTNNESNSERVISLIELAAIFEYTFQ